MQSYKPSSWITGETLDKAIEQTNETRTALIESLLYQRSIMLMSADPGCGKSTIVANVIAQASAGLPVFGAFHVPRPLKCLYIPFERGKEEIVERFLHMRKSILWNRDNIFIYENPDCPIPNLLAEKDQDFILREIERQCPDVDIIFYDPIYASVIGGLSNEDRVSVFTRFNSRVVDSFGCATWLNHHTVKKGMDRDGMTIEREDPFYGSQFLKAHCTCSYYLKNNPSSEGTVLLLKKDNWSVHSNKIELIYHPEDYTSEHVGGIADTSFHNQLKSAHRLLKQTNKTFSFAHLKSCMPGVSTSYLRKLLTYPQYTPHFRKCKSIGKATLYEAVGEI